MMRVRKEKGERKRRRGDLSRDDLLFLLSILEGELQVRRFIHILNIHQPPKLALTSPTAITLRLKMGLY